MGYDDYLDERDRQMADAYADHLMDLAKEDESERRYYRLRALDAFFKWEADELPSITRRDESLGYEAFHERRLALGLTEAEVKAEREAYVIRAAEPVAVCDLF